MVVEYSGDGNIFCISKSMYVDVTVNIIRMNRNMIIFISSSRALPRELIFSLLVFIETHAYNFRGLDYFAFYCLGVGMLGLNILGSEVMVSVSAFVRVGGLPKKVDVGIMYYILVAIRDSPSRSLNFTEIVKQTGYSPNTVAKYIEIMKAKGLVEEKANKERRFYLTKKGEDFVFLFSRAIALLGE